MNHPATPPLTAGPPSEPVRGSAASSSLVVASLREAVAAGGATPIYHRLELTIRELLDSGVLSPADFPLSARQLAKLLHVDRSTMRRALRRLDDSPVGRTPPPGHPGREAS